MADKLQLSFLLFLSGIILMVFGVKAPLPFFHRLFIIFWGAFFIERSGLFGLFIFA